MDRADQAGELGIGGRLAELGEHQPAHLLGAGDALAVGDLAPDLQCPDDHAVDARRQTCGTQERCDGDVPPPGKH
jgi:hypothetical protein